MPADGGRQAGRSDLAYPKSMRACGPARCAATVTHSVHCMAWALHKQWRKETDVCRCVHVQTDIALAGLLG